MQLPVEDMNAGGADSWAAEYLAEEARHAGPLIDEYAKPGIPHDRLIRIDEGGEVTAFPLDYPIYALGS